MNGIQTLNGTTLKVEKNKPKPMKYMKQNKLQQLQQPQQEQPQPQLARVKPKFKQPSFPPKRQHIGNELHVGNLPFSWGNDDLMNMFQEFNTLVTKAEIVKRKNGQSKGYGFVTLNILDSNPNFQIIINRLNGMMAEGRQLTVGAQKQQNWIELSGIPIGTTQETLLNMIREKGVQLNKVKLSGDGIGYFKTSADPNEVIRSLSRMRCSGGGFISARLFSE
eukprot:TRINITY_DN333_c0_g1_i3.p1 TRINITY_DN333_c0_g1~~TRINITY_DN333_c0_g1_i3.p1  ORF type:complete len:221 (+),score=61.00 TRINITY_DN333_c0_g1_i3:613-1275(+)